MKLIKSIFALIIVLVSAILCQQIISDSISNQKNKYDYAELNHIKYGLLSVDEWKRQITSILTEEINKLYLTPATKEELKKPIEALLNTLIDKVYQKIKEENSGTTKGKVKQAFIKTFVKIDEVKKGIPEYADALINEITKAKTKKQIKSMLNKQLQQYLTYTFDAQDKTPIAAILLNTESKDIESAKAKLSNQISVKNSRIVNKSALLIFLCAVLFSLFVFSKQALAPFPYILLVLTLIILLTAGVTTPMIDMEAKISQMSLVIAGNVIQFDNQILYFQSKSILDVFSVMIKHKDISMKFVGVLLITFSIFFPLLKIISSAGYYFNYRNARKNRLIEFFVLKSGKWSMADVMVVAIFMAYIGFNGIISSQIHKISAAMPDQEMLTTNGTSLQPGYYLFVTYTLLGLFLAGLLSRKDAVHPAVASAS